MKHLILVSIGLIFSIFLFAQQGLISGKVVDASTGQPLVGATVILNNGKKVTKSDLNGSYAFASLSEGTYSISCSYVSYSKTEISSIKTDNKEPVYIDLIMQRSADLSAVVVTSTAAPKTKESVSALLLAQKNAASVSDGISAEVIRRTPDRNTSEVLRRVSGASIQEDKFAIVRGLNERYNAAFINGSPLPSSESDRKAFSFDIFPSNMLENLIIYKTATPDMSGEFAGGHIAINTKSIPVKNFQSFSMGFGFNTIATFRERKEYELGQWDFLGIDNSRALPNNTPDIQTFKQLSLQDRNRYANAFQPRNWGLQTGTAGPNTNLQYTLGRNYKHKQRDFLGVLFSVSYSKSNNRNIGTRTFFSPEYDNAAQRVYDEANFSSQTLLGLNGNITWKINTNNSISFRNLFSINADNRVLTRNGKDDVINEPDRYTKSYALWFTSNQIINSQLIGEHYFPKFKWRINWLGSVARINRTIPALRRMVYDSVAGSDAYLAKLLDPNPVDNDNTAGLTFYSTNKETVYNTRIDLSRSFNFGKQIQSLFKMGFYYQNRSRSFNPRLLAYCSYNTATFDMSILKQEGNVIFNQYNIGNRPNGKTGLTMKDITEIRDLYTAGTDLLSYYAMADQRFGKKWRLIYGARVEQFQQRLDASFNAFKPVRVRTSKIDVLPSVNFVFSPTSKQNIRLGYSTTLNRPEFRELAPFLFRDYTIRYAIFGDTALRRASIENFDLRYEIFPGKSQLISVSGFYKRFTDPIELISATNQDRTLTYRNTPSATVYGAELEFRTLLSQLLPFSEHPVLNQFTLFGNLCFVQSKVDLRVTDTANFYYNKGRAFQGQSPYVLNAGLIYQNDVKNISATVSVNRYGQRIFLASNGDALQNGTLIEPNLLENGRTQIDFQFSKQFPKRNMELRINVKDILAQQLFFFEDINNNNKFDNSVDGVRSTQNFGRVISATLTYSF